MAGPFPYAGKIARVSKLSAINSYGGLTIFVITTILTTVNRSAQRRRPNCPEELVFLDLLRTTDILSRGLIHILKNEDLSANQYNVLRILRGSPEGLPCGEIAARMITRDPDITRLLDRLEKRNLISRCRETRDRRMVMARITPEGLKLLARLDDPIQQGHRKQLGHLGRQRLQALAELLQAARRMA